MALDPVNDKVEIYNTLTKRQRLADVSDFSNVTSVPPYICDALTPIPCTAGTPVTLVFAPPFNARASANPAEPPGFYNVYFSLTGTIDHTAGQPNDRFGAKIKTTVTAGAATAIDQAPVVFTGEDFTIRVVKAFQLADTKTIVVTVQTDVDCTITPTEAFLQAVYLSA